MQFALMMWACTGTEEVVRPSVPVPPFAPAVHGRVLRFGRYTTTGGSVQPAPDTNTGQIVSGASLAFEEETETIHLAPGVAFGYQYAVEGIAEAGPVRLRRVLRHPEMVLPDGSKTTGSERNIIERASGGQVYAIDGYALTEPYELVSGAWRFEIWHEEALLLSQGFATVP